MLSLGRRVKKIWLFFVDDVHVHFLGTKLPEICRFTVLRMDFASLGTSDDEMLLHEVEGRENMEMKMSVFYRYRWIS
jgi:hypothetical protein